MGTDPETISRGRSSMNTAATATQSFPLTPATFLAPGQRYAEHGVAPWRVDKQWTVVHVGLANGTPSVVYRCPNGHQIAMPAEQFEAAVTTGQLIPVAGSGRMAFC